jgi:hypothetical protein
MVETYRYVDLYVYPIKAIGIESVIERIDIHDIDCVMEMEEYGIVMYSRMQGKVFVYSQDKDMSPTIEI